MTEVTSFGLLQHTPSADPAYEQGVQMHVPLQRSAECDVTAQQQSARYPSSHSHTYGSYALFP